MRWEVPDPHGDEVGAFFLRQVDGRAGEASLRVFIDIRRVLAEFADEERHTGRVGGAGEGRDQLHAAQAEAAHAFKTEGGFFAG